MEVISVAAAGNVAIEVPLPEGIWLKVGSCGDPAEVAFPESDAGECRGCSQKADRERLCSCVS